ncbi:hypothetical protein M422DRAFT_264796 [Sphaerobolus stellatus SS14]|uniref:Uncharacterized protein n=1 Tax=Sphaerobolus stellatus (strain SS14) TaxID=990650 RepID=A0A0C9UVF8_SPHS4|nr:hypothetical protein M422DRAFT_264796 [Sphaerobolus stellatus SS14]
MSALQDTLSRCPSTQEAVLWACVPYARIILTEPLAFLNCPHVESSQQCRYQHKGFSKIKTHLKEKHTYNSHVTALITLWPDPPAADDKQNEQSILREDVEHLKALWVEFKIVRNLKDVPRPPNGGPPLPGIKILSGIACRHCPHIAQEVGLMVTQWYGYHTEDRTPYSDEYVWRPVYLQVLTGSALRYFEVVLPPAAAAPPGDPWDMYINQHESKFPIYATVNLAPTLNEVPPLQKDTGWHIVFADVITSQRKVKEYMQWIAPPPQHAPDGRETRLNSLNFNYLKLTRKDAQDSSMIVRSAVMDSPIRDESRHWIPLDDDSNLKKYAASLYHFLLAILRSLDDRERVDRLALTEQDLIHASALLKDLQHSKQPNFELIHELFIPLCYPRKLGPRPPSSKWNNPLECLIALQALQEKDQFIEPSLATQLFAKVKYQI